MTLESLEPDIAELVEKLSLVDQGDALALDFESLQFLNCMLDVNHACLGLDVG